MRLWGLEMKRHTYWWLTLDVLSLLCLLSHHEILVRLLHALYRLGQPGHIEILARPSSHAR
jgi:hypothetical protein